MTQPEDDDFRSCFICGNPAKTEEHIFPKWLQKRFSLWDERLGLPNGTSIPYRQLKIPCCSDCNNNILSSLETKIKNSAASPDEIWKWGAKIHFGLLRKDDFLDWDRKNPGYKIGDVIKPNDPLELERHLVHSIHGEFSTHPDPFGSTYVFEFAEEQPYHFAHLLNPAGLCICLGHIGYVIFVRDGGSLTRQPSVRESFRKHADRPHLGKMLNFFANSWTHLYRHRVSTPMIMSKNAIMVIGRGKLLGEREFTDEMFESLWRYVSGNPDARLVSTEEYEETNGLGENHT